MRDYKSEEDSRKTSNKRDSSTSSYEKNNVHVQFGTVHAYDMCTAHLSMVLVLRIGI